MSAHQFTKFVNVAARNYKAAKEKVESGTATEPEQESKPQPEPQPSFWDRLQEKIKKLMKHPLIRVVKFLLFLLAYLKIATIIWRVASDLLKEIRKAAHAAHA